MSTNRERRLSNDSRGSRPIRDPGILLSVQLLIRLTNPFIVLLVVRRLSPEEFATYAVATSIVYLMTLVSDFGIAPATLKWATQESRGPKAALIAGLSLGGLLSALGAACAVVWASIASESGDTVMVTAVLTLTLPSAATTSTVSAVFQSIGRYKTVSHLAMTSAGFNWTLLFVALFVLEPSSVNVAIAQSVPTLVVGLIYLIRLIQTLGFRPGNISLHRLKLKRFLVDAWQFGLGSSFYQMYSRADAGILASFRPPREVGQYTLAYRLVSLPMEIPSVLFNHILYPKLFLWAGNNKSRVRLYLSLTQKCMSILGSLIALILASQAHVLTSILFGSSYLNVAPLLQVLAWMVPTQFISAALSAVLTTQGHIKLRLWIQGAVVTGNIVFNVLLIPIFGAPAAAWVMVCSALLLLIGFWIATYERAEEFTTPIRTAATLLTPPAGAAIAFFVARSTGGVVSASILGAAIIISPLILRAWLSNEETEELIRLVRRETTAIREP